MASVLVNASMRCSYSAMRASFFSSTETWFLRSKNLHQNGSRVSHRRLDKAHQEGTHAEPSSSSSLPFFSHRSFQSATSALSIFSSWSHRMRCSRSAESLSRRSAMCAVQLALVAACSDRS